MDILVGKGSYFADSFSIMKFEVIKVPKGFGF